MVVLPRPSRACSSTRELQHGQPPPTSGGAALQLPRAVCLETQTSRLTKQDEFPTTVLNPDQNVHLDHHLKFLPRSPAGKN